MKTYYILLLFACVMLFASCDKMPKNGDLDGMWQLMTVERAGEEAEFVKTKKLYYSFQLDLVQLNDATMPNDRGGYYAYFKHSGDSLFIRKICFPSANETAADNNIEFTSADLPKIAPWGIYTLNPRFKVWELDSDDMVLESNEAKLTFRKF